MIVGALFIATIESGSTLSIYAHLFGWNIFDMLVVFLGQTGFWTLPFFVYLYKASLEHKEKGEKYDPGASVRSFATNVIFAIFTITVFIYPSVDVKKIAFVHVNTNGITLTAGKTGTTYDNFETALPASVKVPVGWYIILKVTGALNAFIKAVLPNTEDIRGTMYQMSTLTIDDPKVKVEVARFEEVCSAPAAKLFSSIMQGKYKDSKIAQQLNKVRTEHLKDKGNAASDWEVNLAYIGNEYYTKVLYKDLPICNDLADANARLCLPPVGIYTKADKYAHKNCNKWWNPDSFWSSGLAHSILKTSNGEKFGVSDLFKKLKSKLGSDGATNELVAKALSQSALPTDDNSNGFWDTIKKRLVGAKLNIAAVVEYFSNEAIVVALPIVQAFMILFIIILTPLLLLFSSYKLDAVIKLGFVYFTITFLSVLWGIITWIDSFLVVAIWGYRGVFDSFTSTFEGVFALVIFASYGLVAYMFGRLMYAIGIRAVDGASGLDKTGGMSNQNAGGGVIKGGAKKYGDHRAKKAKGK